MGNRVRTLDLGTQQGRRIVRELGDELREARLRAGLRQLDVARRLATSQSRVSGVELGKLGEVSVAHLARHAAIVGLRLHARMHPAGPPLRDQAQLALLERFRRRLDGGLELWLEVPVTPEPRDQRAWDAVVRGTGPEGPFTVGVEAITRLRDVQAQLRSAQLKRTDAALERLILLVAATHANRHALAEFAGLVEAAFPVNTRQALVALGHRTDPGGDALILL
jgi:transcriptional regulator with XRE-family HTH domain